MGGKWIDNTAADKRHGRLEIAFEPCRIVSIELVMLAYWGRKGIMNDGTYDESIRVAGRLRQRRRTHETTVVRIVTVSQRTDIQHILQLPRRNFCAKKPPRSEEHTSELQSRGLI